MVKYKAQTKAPYPLGSTYDGKGVNFALFSAHATKVELCIFNESGSEELARYTIEENTSHSHKLTILND